MDGVHDLGGLEGFGAIEVEVDEPVFHHDWERRTWGLVLSSLAARLGAANGSRFRHAIERMEPVHYLRSPYYEHWVTALATLLVESGVVEAPELERRAGGRFPLSAPVLASAPADTSGRTFAVGDQVRVRDVAFRGHTRCPRYVRRRTGTVVRVDPPHPLPEREERTGERAAETVYSVAFAARELWGADAAERTTVHVDLWQSYLEPA